jgi:N6-adenosine-specific RNA methylase IME4
MAYSLNLCRRHLRPEQRRDVVARLREKRWSTTRIAEAIGVDEKTVRNDLSGSENSEPESPVTGQDGKSYPSSLPAPAQIADRRDRAQELREQGQSMPRIAQELGVSVGTVHADLRASTVVRASGAKEVGQASRVLDRVQDTPAGTFSVQELRRETGREIREQNRQERIAEIVSNSKPLESGVGTYPVILADPPWRYEHCDNPGDAIENHYPTMSLDDICNLPVSSVAGDNCILFCWATSPKLAESFRVLAAWGFDYRTCLVWVKDRIGMGYWARQRHELLLVATRGSIPVPAPDARPDSVISAPRGRHSEKPIQAYEIIEAMFPDLPKLELFCRSPREGWAAWGNEA